MDRSVTLKLQRKRRRAPRSWSASGNPEHALLPLLRDSACGAGLLHAVLRPTSPMPYRKRRPHFCPCPLRKGARRGTEPQGSRLSCLVRPPLERDRVTIEGLESNHIGTHHGVPRDHTELPLSHLRPRRPPQVKESLNIESVFGRPPHLRHDRAYRGQRVRYPVSRAAPRCALRPRHAPFPSYSHA